MKEVNKQSCPTGISRREFLGMAATGAAALTILPSFTVAGLGHVAPSDKLYIAKIGCGGMGAADLGSLMNTPHKNAAITCLCDVDDRQSADARKKYPKAKYFNDFREMYDKEGKNFDAVCISTPDHNHAIQAFGAMRMGKHVYLQKPIAHDIYEARILTEAAKKYKVVTQMGDQGNSCDGMRTLREWFEADLLGDIQKVYCWTNRPVWPQGIPWPSQKPEVPKGLNWDLWVGIFEEAYYPESCPVASSIRYKFKKKDGSDLNLYWMDGGIMPERFEEIDPDADMTCTMGDLDMMDVEGATVFVGTKGMASCGWGGSDPRFWPKGQKANKKPLFDKDVNIPHKYKRIEGGTNGHYWAWIDSCIAGYDKADVESPFEGYAGPLTETVLMGNLILRSYNIREQVKHNDSIYGEREGFIYPGRNKTFQWDGANMRITNFEQANQFIKRKYRDGWEDLKL